MSQRCSEKLTFQDVASCFSQEEWNLLHEWQEELYTNVMKEIHQSMLSLGPVIAASVFSLRAKEKEDLYRISPPNSETNHSTAHSSRFPSLYEDVEQQNVDKSNGTFVGHPGARGESTSDRGTGNAAIPDVFMVRIKEEETYNMGQEATEMAESISRPTGNGSIGKQRKVVLSLKRTGRSTPPCQPTIGKAKSKGQKCNSKGTDVRTQVWSVSNRKLRGEKPNPYESGFSNSTHFSVHQGGPKLTRPEKYDKRESKPINPLFLKDLLSTQHNMRMFSCTQCDKSYSMKGELIRHMITHSGVRPYPCTECGKSFFQMPHLIRHQTTHSGEKPFTCTFCHKRFNRKDYLNAHRRIHTGERPYKCTECEKSYTWKGELNQHLKKHLH
ncbi:zinc finger protein 528-like [Ambystoma mexicanum]|uniref:zinc finger protein 528-like n=1 Tax=Ambystoma mexicanum TaxID=8296 RepID=UPI0037E8CDC7